MDYSKEEAKISETRIDDVEIVEKDTNYGGIPSKYRGTDVDKRDMIVLGKKQVLRVSLNLVL